MEGGYRKFDVILVDFGDDVLAGEQGGIRPAVIVQNNLGNLHSPTTLVFPFTTQKRSLTQSTHSFFRANEKYGLTKDSYLLGEAIKQISELRILKKLGRIVDKTGQDEIQRVFFANWGL
ncbi:type II toxin-antitoxin system PemK/MazF family toxin [Clostridium sp. AF32-12BH]|uniref:type II toxin-antitoxin system PemK/MazF family toxin n=1 Tax=Clostridium sp. AF32-12BH TaxID=2292006 RepID=UPI0015FB9B11|nr:type II toxin-antitoxin system PemK/MazF family toxin [Clostridium sp. AF32-12BH]